MELCNPTLCQAAASKSSKKSGAPGAEWYQYETNGIIPGGAGTGRLSLSVQIEPDAYFVVQKLTATFTGNFSTQIQDTGSSQILMDNFVQQANLWGTAAQPNLLIDPLIFSPSSLVLFNLLNGIAGANTVQLVVEGYKHYDLKNPPFIRAGNIARSMTGRLAWFQYTISPAAALAANSAPTFTIPIQADSYFLVRKLVSIQTGIFSARFSDTSRNANWQRNYIRNGSLFGTVNFPNIMRKPRLLAPNTVVTVELQELSGAGNTVQLVLEGVKQYI